MTVRIPPDNILDKILKFFKKERKIIIPDEAGKAYREIGPYVQIMGKKENFFKALIRKIDEQKPEKGG